MADHKVTYDSIEAISRVAVPLCSDGTYSLWRDTRWVGFESIAELKSLAVDGWEAEAATALAIAEAAVETVEQDHDMPHFRAVWDVSGCEVDVARYLSGEPENMIDYEMTSTPRAGRVIVLCASVSYSSSVSVSSIKRRGHGIAALAFALSRMGLTVELWADLSSKCGRSISTNRVLVKGANDLLDPARIMFAYAHPGMLRGLMMASMHAWPEPIRKRHEVGSGYGQPTDPRQDLPDGTIYLPSVLTDRDVPNAKEMLIKHLSVLGLIDE